MENAIGIHEILFVIKMLSKENGWCHRVEFFYDSLSPQKSILTFFIGPIKYKAVLARNLGEQMFAIPADSMMSLPLNNSFVIFINDANYGQCVMLTKKKILEYMESKPAPATGFTMVDCDYIYGQRLWTSELPTDEDLMILYPGKYKKR